MTSGASVAVAVAEVAASSPAFAGLALGPSRTRGGCLPRRSQGPGPLASLNDRPNLRNISRNISRRGALLALRRAPRRLGPTPTSSAATARSQGSASSPWTAEPGGLTRDPQGDRGGDRPPVPRREVAHRHHRRPAGHPSHDGAARAATDGRRPEGSRAAAVHDRPVRPLRRRAAREVPGPAREPAVRHDQGARLPRRARPSPASHRSPPAAQSRGSVPAAADDAGRAGAGRLPAYPPTTRSD